MRPIWVAKYIGVPYLDGGRDPKGWDCLGLVRWVVRERLGIELPDYTERYAASYDKVEIESIARGEAAIHGVNVDCGFELELDVALFRGLPMHCGVVIAYGEMLNVRRGSDTVIDNYYSHAWRHRLIGFWRHP